MEHFMYDVSVPVFGRALRNLSAVLALGEANAKERGIDPQVFLSGRLAPDMLHLVRQVQIACDNAKGATYRLAGREVPSAADTETTFEELEARIQKTRDLIKDLKSEEFAGAAERPIVLKMRQGELNFVGIGYLTGFALPNFFFHCTTAYDILRHNGVPLTKRDFLGRAD